MVFVTAFDQRAVEAFEVNAVDYVLKPVEPRGSRQAVPGPAGGGAKATPLAGQLDGWSG